MKQAIFYFKNQLKNVRTLDFGLESYLTAAFPWLV